MLSSTLLVLLAAQPVTVEMSGTLKQVISEIANVGEMNVVVIGDMSEPAQVRLKNVSPDTALTTLSKAYNLDVTHEGEVWIINKHTAANAMPQMPALPALPALPPLVLPALPPLVLPAVPAMPALPSVGTNADELRAKADGLRTEAELARTKLESLRNASEEARELAEANYEAAQEAADDAEEQFDDINDAQEEANDAKAELDEAREELQRHRVTTGVPLTIAKGERVENAVAYGGPVTVEEGAHVEGDAVAFGGDVILKRGSVVEGDAVSFGGTVVREPGAIVEGQTASMGGTTLGTVMARSASKANRATKHEEAAREDDGFSLPTFLVQFATLFGLGFMLLVLAPGRMKAMESSINAEFTKNSVVGVLGVIALVPLTLLLCVTIIGIPVAMLMWMLLALAVPAGVALVANVLGTRLPTGRIRKTQAIALALGVLVLLVAFHIPVMGVLALLAVVSVGLGAMIRTRFGQAPRGLPMVDNITTAVI
jgi:hypothetical protein